MTPTPLPMLLAHVAFLSLVGTGLVVVQVVQCGEVGGGALDVATTNQTTQQFDELLQRRATAQRLVDDALSAIKDDGLETVINEINNKNNTRFRGDTTSDVNAYVNVLANNGTILAHGQRPDEFVGRTADEVIASSIPQLVGKLDGDEVNAMLVEKAQAGGGWLTYCCWITPTTGIVYNKSSYVKQPAGYKDIYVGSGYEEVDATTTDVAPAPEKD
ncbi:hypothetical protein RI054_21g94040 [Pseudoscourfieldia marina]